MTNRNTPSITTITTADQPHQRERQVIRHPLVRRRVGISHDLTIGGRTHRGGECVTIAADQAFVLEQAGVLVAVDDAA